MGGISLSIACILVALVSGRDIVPVDWVSRRVLGGRRSIQLLTPRLSGRPMMRWICRLARLTVIWWLFSSPRLTGRIW